MKAYSFAEILSGAKKRERRININKKKKNFFFQKNQLNFV